MGEFPRGRHPNSRRNLIPFSRGDDPNRKVGSPNIGRKITSFFNELSTVDEDDRAVYDVMTLRTIAADPEAPHPKAIAATLLLAAREKGFDKLDRMPKSLAAIKEILDRLLGRPRLEIDISHHHAPHRTADEVLQDIKRILRESMSVDGWRVLLTDCVRQRPELVDMLREVADKAPVLTEATPIDEA